jgi:hypothetical protein
MLEIQRPCSRISARLEKTASCFGICRVLYDAAMVSSVEEDEIGVYMECRKHIEQGEVSN